MEQMSFRLLIKVKGSSVDEHALITVVSLYKPGWVKVFYRADEFDFD